MATVLDIVSRSLRILGVLDVNQSVKAGDLASAIVALNGMMRRWEADGTALGWATVEAGTETLPAPDEAHDAIAYNLALRLRSEYRVSLDPDVVAFARDGLAALQRDRLVEMPIEQSLRLPGRGGYNIYTDEFN